MQALDVEGPRYWQGAVEEPDADKLAGCSRRTRGVHLDDLLPRTGRRGETRRLIVLLCSDGLTNMVPDRHIQEIVSSRDRMEDACDELVAEANAQGGRDNISAILVRYDP